MKSLIRQLATTTNDIAPVITRLALGLVMLPHGLQKTVGLFGGHGFSGTVGFFTGNMGMPWIVAVLVILAESVGSLMLIFGVLTRFAAASNLLVMIGAVVMVHGPNGFFMNWYGSQAGEGFEYHLLAAGLAISLILTGAGRWSVDRKLGEI